MNRPRIHLTGERGWINDPHGVTWDGRRYHVFHQAVPDSLAHRNDCSWGHATSPDLLRFERRPVALAPGEGDVGIWTGALVVDDAGEPLILYTSVAEPDVGMGRVRVARAADDSWDTWVKGDVVVEAPADAGLAEFRDPVVVREGEGWRMFVGGTTRESAVALTWTSPDLQRWTYDGVALERSAHETEPVWMGEGWECPQFADLGDAWVMVTSVWQPWALHHAGFAVGRLEGGRFDAADWGRLTWGRYYAPSLFRDAEGRPCLMHWMREVRGEDWTSCLSVPHVLSLDAGRPVLAPHPLLDAALGDDVDPAGPLPDAPLDVRWSAGEGDALSLTGPEGATTLRVAAGSLDVVEAGGDVHTLPLEPLGDSGAHAVRLLLDGPALEVWSSGRPLAAVAVPADRLEATGHVRVRRVDPR